MINRTWEDRLVDNGKGHTVIWSGGFDSTLILYQVAAKFGTKETPVVALTIIHDLIHSKKRKKEEESRARLLDEFECRGLYVVNKLINVSSDDSVPAGSGRGIPQVFMWLSSVLIHAHKQNLYFGYIRSDDFWHYSEGAYKLLESARILVGIDTEMIIPLEFVRKGEVLKQMRNEGLYDMSWYCETPGVNMVGDLVPCNTCCPCITHDLALVELAISGEEWAQSKLGTINLKYIPPLK